jgi:hypothetical protein
VKLHVELQEGWSGDLVDVTVDGKAAYQGRPKTRMQTGYAAGVEVDVPDDGGGRPVLVEVRLPERGIVVQHEVEAGRETWVGLTLAGDDVRVRDQPAPFGYV